MSKKSSPNACNSNREDNNNISNETLLAENKLLKAKVREFQRKLIAVLAKVPQPEVMVHNPQPEVAAKNQQPENPQPANPQPIENEHPAVIKEMEKDTFQLKTKARWARAGRGGRGRGRGPRRGRGGGNTIINYINM